MVMSLWPHFLAHLELLSVGLELGRGPVMHRSLSRIRQVAPIFSLHLLHGFLGVQQSPPIG